MNKKLFNYFKRYYIEIFLSLITVLGTIVRVWKISYLPFPPNDSELFFGYYGWSLLHFGMDEFGRKWPMNFPSIGDFKYPGLAYLNILPAAFFGLSYITARFWAVFSGIIMIPVTYFLSLYIFRNKLAAFISSFLIAFSPWGIILSRMGYENYVAVALVCTAILLFLMATIKLSKIGEIYSKISTFSLSYRKVFLAISLVLFLLASFTYAAQRIFIPLFFGILLILTFIKKTELENTRKTVLIFLLILSTIIIASLIPWQNRGRSSSLIYNKISSGEASKLEETIFESRASVVKVPPFLTTVFQNKTRVFGYHLLEKYFFHFSPEFLFFNGDASYERIPGSGQLLIIELIFLPLGLILLFSRDYYPRSLIIFFSLLIAPLASSITLGSSINRASIMIPFLCIISGVGAGYLYASKYRFKLLIISILALGTIYSLGYSFYQIFVIKPVHQAWYTEIVNNEMVNYVWQIKDNFDGVVIPKDEYIYFLYYEKISPTAFLSDSEIKPLNRQNPWDRVDRLSNIHFNMQVECPAGGKENVVYVCRGENVPRNSKIIKVIRYRDGAPAYVFLTFYPISKMPKVLPDLPERLKYMVDLESGKDRPEGIIEKGSSDWW